MIKQTKEKKADGRPQREDEEELPMHAAKT
jgi:hypothetical protein